MLRQDKLFIGFILIWTLSHVVGLCLLGREWPDGLVNIFFAAILGVAVLIKPSRSKS